MDSFSPHVSPNNATKPAIVEDNLHRHYRRFGAITQADEPLLAGLSNDHQAILRQQGRMQDIAERLHLSVGTVKSRLHRARAALIALRERSKI